MKKPTITKRIIERVASFVLFFGVLFCLLPINYAERGGILSTPVFQAVALGYLLTGILLMIFHFDRLVLIAMACSAVISLAGQIRENRMDLIKRNLEINERPVNVEMLKSKIAAIKPVFVSIPYDATESDTLLKQMMLPKYPFFRIDSTQTPPRMMFSKKPYEGYIDLRR